MVYFMEKVSSQPFHSVHKIDWYFNTIWSIPKNICFYIAVISKFIIQKKLDQHIQFVFTKTQSVWHADLDSVEYISSVILELIKVTRQQCHNILHHDKTRQDKTRQDKTRQDNSAITFYTMTRQDKTWQDNSAITFYTMTRQDKTRQDKTRQDKTRHDKTTVP